MGIWVVHILSLFFQNNTFRKCNLIADMTNQNTKIVDSVYSQKEIHFCTTTIVELRIQVNQVNMRKLNTQQVYALYEMNKYIISVYTIIIF
jgi:signal transduction histidine kinase